MKTHNHQAAFDQTLKGVGSRSVLQCLVFSENGGLCDGQRPNNRGRGAESDVSNNWAPLQQHVGRGNRQNVGISANSEKIWDEKNTFKVSIVYDVKSIWEYLNSEEFSPCLRGGCAQIAGEEKRCQRPFNFFWGGVLVICNKNLFSGHCRSRHYL